MLTSFTRRLSYANVVATLALFIALGGTSLAALSLTGADIRDGSLRGRDLRSGTLTGRQIQDGSLGLREISGVARTALRGARGHAGASGTARAWTQVQWNAGSSTCVVSRTRNVSGCAKLGTGHYKIFTTVSVADAVVVCSFSDTAGMLLAPTECSADEVPGETFSVQVRLAQFLQDGSQHIVRGDTDVTAPFKLNVVIA